MDRRIVIIGKFATLAALAVLLVHFNRPASNPELVDPTVTFAGRSWKFAGPCSSSGDVFRFSMDAVHYTTDEPGVRLLELLPRESRPLEERVFTRIVGVQMLQEGRWVSHGKRFEWLRDGSRGISEFHLGKLHGTQRDWYPNGQLHIEREWAGGEMNGRARGWYPSGAPEYDVQNVAGKEISGTAWDENGTPR